MPLFRNLTKQLSACFRRSGEVEVQTHEPIPKKEDKESVTNVNPQTLIDAFKYLLITRKRWFLFQNGTVVIGKYEIDTTEYALEEAKEFLKENGKIIPGTPLGDFNPKFVEELNGWLVMFHTDRIYTFVPGPQYGPDGGDLSLGYGLVGRGLRRKDSEELHLVYTSMAESINTFDLAC